MREIKFRMWNYCGAKSKFLYSFQALECMNQQQLGIYDHEKDGCAFEQFTGLRDKNGREIYEGDILHNAENYAPYNCVIEWRDDLGSCGCCYSACESVGFVGRVLPGSDYVYSDLAAGYKDMEVIGNIHENPELLK